MHKCLMHDTRRRETVGLFLRINTGLSQEEQLLTKRFSLVIMECIGACGTAPAMLVNDDFYENLTEKYIEEILEKYK